MLLTLPAVAPATAQPIPVGDLPEIVVTPPPTEGERHHQLRDLTRTVIRPPRLNQPVARFFYPVCVQVLGLSQEDAAVVAERIRENARVLGVGADERPDCVPTVRVGFMAPAAGPPQRWLTPQSAQLAHLPLEQREHVLAEAGPVRAWNRVAVRDYLGQPIEVGEMTFIDPQPLSRGDPLVRVEITGAAVLVAREAAQAFTLGQLADYATLRTLLGTSVPDRQPPAPTILTLFSETDPPEGLTAFDQALVRELYDASRNASARRVYNDIARAAVAAERSDRRGNEAP